MKTRKKQYPIYASKKLSRRHIDLLLIGKEGKRHYVLIKYFNTLMYNHTLHCRRQHFCGYCSQTEI